MKGIILWIVSSLWILAIGVMIFQVMKQKPVDIVTAFSNNDFPSVSSNVEALAELGSIYLSDNEREKLAVTIAEQLGINEEYETEAIREDSRVELTLTKEALNVTTYIKVITIEEQKSNAEIKLYQYVIIDMDFHNTVHHAIIYRDKIQKIINKFDEEPQITVNLNGCVQGNLNIDEKNRLVNKLLKDIEGKVIVENRKDELYSVYGYTKKVSEYINIDNKKININIGVRYNETDQMTNVYMSTPIINFDY